MADIDVLVRPEHREAASAVLRELGYRPAGNDAEAVGAYRSFLLLEREGTFIDLHWHIADYSRVRNAIDVDHEGLWRRARRFSAGSSSACTLSAEDTLVHLALHLTIGSEFGTLLSFSDIDAVLRAEATVLDWNTVVEIADRWRVRALLGYVLEVVSTSFDSPVPAAARQRLSLTGLRGETIRWCLGVPTPPSLHGLSDTRVYLGETLLMDRVTDVLRVAGGSLFPSSRWLTLHYALSARWQVSVFRALHPFRIGYLAIKGLR